MTATTGELVFDPYDYDFQDDPYPTYRRLRDEAPLFHETEHDFWVLSRYDDVHRALRTDGVFSNQMGVTLDASAWNENAHHVMSFLAMDPPEQTRLRKLVSKGFTPRRIRELQPRIQALTDDYLARCLELNAEQGGFDWIADFAGKLPMDVISEMLGVPVADRDEVRRQADLLVVREDGLRDVPPAGMAAAGTLFGYFTDLLKAKKAQPGGDLASALLRVEDGGQGMADQEIIAFLFLMVVAGNETTTKLLGNAMYHLGGHPDQLAEVFGGAGAPDLVDPWIEETLRYDGSTQLLARLLVDDLSLHGVTAPAGAQLLFALGAANHDERVFTDADGFDIHRDPAELSQLISFGGGRHFCLGANLARLEARVALHSLVALAADIRVDHDRAERFYSANVRGFAHLPIAVTPR